jgi:hypothetical protein
VHRARVAAAGVAVGAAAGAAVWAGWIEPRRLRVRHVELRLPRWPAAWDGFRLALISDLHAGAPHVGLERVADVVARTNAEGPDLVALLGDYVDPKVAFGTELSPEAVAERLSALRAPLGVAAVLGNHDWLTDGPRVAAALARFGVRVLENEPVRIRRAPTELWVAGVADANERRADIVDALRGVPNDAATILLSHDPDVFPRVPDTVALTLSGHTHGGQVNLPAARAKVIPSRFGTRYSDGHVIERGRHLFISRGIGTSRLPIRFGAPPEVIVLTLRPE